MSPSAVDTLWSDKATLAEVVIAATLDASLHICAAASRNVPKREAAVTLEDPGTVLPYSV